MEQIPHIKKDQRNQRKRELRRINAQKKKASEVRINALAESMAASKEMAKMIEQARWEGFTLGINQGRIEGMSYGYNLGFNQGRLTKE